MGVGDEWDTAAGKAASTAGGRMLRIVETAGVTRSDLTLQMEEATNGFQGDRSEKTSRWSISM